MAITAAIAMWAVCGAAVLPGARDAAQLDFTFRGPDAKEYEARLLIPHATARKGVAVLMLGGGYGNDLLWTTPASYEHEGRNVVLTISGEAHRDGEAIAGDLAAPGAVVMLWSTIPADDHAGRLNPAAARGRPYPETRELAAAALRAFRARPELGSDRVVLLGFSLGATRACQIADAEVAGFILLAGAYLSKTEESPRARCAAVAGELGIAADAWPLDKDAFEKIRTDDGCERGMKGSFEDLDRDRDGVLRAWELAGALDAARGGVAASATGLRGGPWPLDVLTERKLPTLMVFGGLDPMSYHGARLRSEGRGGDGDEWLTIDFVPAVGHGLGPERDGRTGPIEGGVVRSIGEWVTRRFAAPAGEKPAKPLNNE